MNDPTRTHDTLRRPQEIIKVRLKERLKEVPLPEGVRKPQLTLPKNKQNVVSGPN